MIGLLPKSLTVAGAEYKIRSDFRTVLLILEAYTDPNLNDYGRAAVCLECLYEDFPREHAEETLKRAVWFIDGGDVPADKSRQVRLMDWQQDEGLIFPAVNKVAGYEVRAVEYLHWWSFLGLFLEVGDGRFATVVSIRDKLARGKPLDKMEREYYAQHRDVIKLHERLTDGEIADRERLNMIFT